MNDKKILKNKNFKNSNLFELLKIFLFSIFLLLFIFFILSNNKNKGNIEKKKFHIRYNTLEIYDKVEEIEYEDLGDFINFKPWPDSNTEYFINKKILDNFLIVEDEGTDGHSTYYHFEFDFIFLYYNSNIIYQMFESKKYFFDETNTDNFSLELHYRKF